VVINTPTFLSSEQCAFGCLRNVRRVPMQHFIASIVAYANCCCTNQNINKPATFQIHSFYAEENRRQTVKRRHILPLVLKISSIFTRLFRFNYHVNNRSQITPVQFYVVTAYTIIKAVLPFLSDRSSFVLPHCSCGHSFTSLSIHRRIL